MLHARHHVGTRGDATEVATLVGFLRGVVLVDASVVEATSSLAFEVDVAAVADVLRRDDAAVVGALPSHPVTARTQSRIAVAVLVESGVAVRARAHTHGRC